MEQVLNRLVELAPKQLHLPLRRIWADCPRFRGFAIEYSSMIQRKFRDSGNNHDAADVFAELETAAWLLSNSSFVVVYEPYGRTGVDFQIRFDEGSFNVETKRIRQTEAAAKFAECLGRIVSAIREIPSPLGISINCYTMDVDPNLAMQLHDSIDAVVSHVCAAVNKLKGILKDGATEIVGLDAFPNLQIRVEHVSEKDPNSPTAYFGGGYPILYTQKESRKYADRIFDAVKQFTAGIPNALVLCSDSITHDPNELRFAIQEIDQSIKDDEVRVFTQRGFKDTSDFAERFRLMTAAVAVSQEPRVAEMPSGNVAWFNPDPETRLYDSIVEWLRLM